MIGTSAAVQTTCRRSAYRPYRTAGRKAEYGRFSVLPRPEIYRNLCIKDSVKIDPACGSGGFLIGALDNVYKQIERERDNENDIIENKKDYASECVFGIDYDKTIAKVAKAYMLIWGDGRSNIASCDGLNSNNWDPETLSKFTVGYGKETKLRQFDIIATNNWSPADRQEAAA